MIAKLQTKSSFSRTGQNREFAQFEALEKRLERWAMPKIRKEMNVIARDILTNYQLGGVVRVNAISIPDGVARLEETLLPIYQRSIDNSIKILKKQNPDVNFDDTLISMISKKTLSKLTGHKLRQQLNRLAEEHQTRCKGLSIKPMQTASVTRTHKSNLGKSLGDLTRCGQGLSLRQKLALSLLRVWIALTNNMRLGQWLRSG
jgi:hypothetical protein